MLAVTASNPPLAAFSAFAGDDRLRVAVTTRAGGVSEGRYASLNMGLHVGDDPAAVRENRRRAAAAFGVRLTECVFAEQVAGTHVAQVDLADLGRGATDRTTAVPATDGLVTTDPGVTLVLMAADCMVVTLVDAAAGVLALVHAGWPGTTSGILPQAVSCMTNLGADPQRIVAAIAPAVDGDTYQVGDDVAAAARGALGDRTGEVLRPDGTGRFLFDLVGAARIQLTAAGVTAPQVHASGAATGPDTPYFSHRFEGPTGRFAVFAQLTGKA